MEWQAHAVEGWRNSVHPARGPRHGIIEAVTGTGKTLAAIACMTDASQEVPDLRIAVVVPGQVLAKQRHRELVTSLGLRSDDVGL
jgi:superfamily II DNA or RNA helicase